MQTGFHIGDTVMGAHGIGKIVAENRIKSNLYFEEKPLEAINIARQCELTAALLSGIYNKDRYPYVVLFEDGYCDVYSSHELELVS